MELLIIHLTGQCPDFAPGQPWVRVESLDEAGRHVRVQLRNNAQAPTYPAGTWLVGHQVRAADALAPGYYLVRDRRLAGTDYVGHLLAEGIESDGLSFYFDGPLPEPIFCGIRRGYTHRVRLYRLEEDPTPLRLAA
ncbi:hypothetical protein [Hymenobacter guriensis]|uniref:Uncharacterized protein n=1 Tax=Hymenobacter guriensis TaxID=2793065 RepID=A0ABS0KXK5_9BACT|nr:hypothetical protein [Hymenobacter guriensis]MBG8552573.1 hypothetical protein [Hymenobacter guriensis]